MGRKTHLLVTILSVVDGFSSSHTSLRIFSAFVGSRLFECRKFVFCTRYPLILLGKKFNHEYYSETGVLTLFLGQLSLVLW
jgi:hypothetical protein